MPRHHAPLAPDVGPILFARDENIAHVMPRVTARAVTSCAHRTACARRRAGHLKYTWRAKITFLRAVRTSRPTSMKINCLPFYSSKYENCKPERAGKDSHYHAQREHGCFK